MKFIHFHSRKCIWKYRLRNGVHFVKAIGILTKVFATFVRILWFQIEWVMTYRADQLGVDTHTHAGKHTHTHTDAGNDNTMRPKLASGKKTCFGKQHWILNTYRFRIPCRWTPLRMCNCSRLAGTHRWHRFGRETTHNNNLKMMTSQLGDALHITDRMWRETTVAPFTNMV